MDAVITDSGHLRWLKLKSCVGVTSVGAALLVAGGPATLDHPQAGMAATPDPVMLLQGVEEARLRILPSRLNVQLTYTNSLGAAGTHSQVIEFDGVKWRYANTTDAACDLFDGTQAIRFDGTDVTISDASQTTADYLFDPRLLGITTTYSFVETLASYAPRQKRGEVQLVGADPIEGDAAWHVHLVDSFNQEKDLWIDPEHGFRVYRSEFRVPGAMNTTTARYEDPAYPWLPTRIETSERPYPGGPVRAVRFIVVSEDEAGIKLPRDTWSLAGVRAQAGAAVTDLRIRKRIGYWDGHGLSSELPITHAP